MEEDTDIEGKLDFLCRIAGLQDCEIAGLAGCKKTSLTKNVTIKFDIIYFHVL